MKLSLLQRVLLFTIIVNVGFIGLMVIKGSRQRIELGVVDFHDNPLHNVIGDLEGTFLEMRINCEVMELDCQELGALQLATFDCLDSKLENNKGKILEEERIEEWVNECFGKKIME